MKAIFDKVSASCSKLTTQAYSTSFSLGIKLLANRMHKPIYAIYGFVRLADEIVDSFADYNRAKLLHQFKDDTYAAIANGISLNPILNSFQEVVNRYHIETALIETFLNSMEMDLTHHFYSRKLYDQYVLGSAEVVGLMCLRVFCEQDNEMYLQLQKPAMKLGSAFQKINFLRDLKADAENLGRNYFPDVDLSRFSENDKAVIQQEIAGELSMGLDGIKQLPVSSRNGVYLAYKYYTLLFKKISGLPPHRIMTERIRVADWLKYSVLLKSILQSKLNRI